MRVLPVLFALLVLAAALPSAADTIHIDITNLSYVPGKVSAHIGDTVEWANKDFVAHTATARNKDWDVKLPPHGNGSVVLKKPGRIAYYCIYHPNMQGEINVSP